MFYKNKETKETVYLVKSDSKRCIIFDYKDDSQESSGGRILQMNKKAFKKHYVKNKKSTKTVPDQYSIDTIITDYETNQYAYDHHLEEYVEDRKYQDRIEAIERQTKEEREQLLKELADDYEA